jgi:4-amino-4-deoxy-L-arabinose transferase-like glycosyltransferase
MRYYLAVILFAVAVYVGCMISPPSLMDDVDAVQAQIARNMITSGDWVTARLDGVAYMEKAPLIYWMMAVSYKIFGVHDWSARIPVVLSSIGLAWITAAFGMWAFGRLAGFYAGLCMATSVGLFLFTRIQIPDVMVAAAMALSMWSFLRAIDEVEARPRIWALIFAATLGTSLLLKSLIGVVFPVAACVVYLAVTRQFGVWRRLRPLSGLLVILAIAAPWHILATLRNPPYFDLTMHSAPGEYHGFLWFFVMNEQVLRFLNLRYPRDYNTVPRVWFWLFHLVWLFPWSVYFPAVAKLSFRPVDRAGKTRLLALCWTGFVLVFFTFSTTQEYYSMPCYPALALLLGSAMAAGGAYVKWGTRLLAVILAGCAIAAGALWWMTRGFSTPGDISSALSQNPDAYTLSLGHIEDLNLQSFAYLRAPLLAAAIAFLIGTIGTMVSTGKRAFVAAGIMMVLFFQAARMALVVFDPYMSSRPLAEALMRAPEGKLIIDHHYYTFSSIVFYTNRDAWLLNGRFNNLVYGSYAPGAPDVFLDDAQWQKIWLAPERCYIVLSQAARARLEKLVGAEKLNVLAASGGKLILCNQPVQSSRL